MSVTRPLSVPNKRSLSPQHQRLLAVFQKIGFGRIPRLHVVGGEPDLRGMRWVRTVKVRGDNEPHPTARVEDFALRIETAEFFRLLDDLRDGELLDVEVRHGQPIGFQVEEGPAY